MVLCGSVLSQVAYNVESGSSWSATTSVGRDAVVPGWFYNLGITGLSV